MLIHTEQMRRQRDIPDLVSDGARERVVVVGVERDGDDAEASLDELCALVRSAGGDVVGRVVQRRAKPDPATYIGKGKAKEVLERARAPNATAAISDGELAPAQGRNLEDLSGVNPLDPKALKFVDRTGLILDVFAQHAHSAEGKLQVGLAQIT